MLDARAEPEEAGASRPEAEEKRIAGKAGKARGRLKYIRALDDKALALKPLWAGPAPDMDEDGTAKVPPPSNAMHQSRYALPLLVEPPEALPSETDRAQIAEAEQHARRVALGLCWQEEADLERFQETKLTYGDIELPAESAWTSDQKYQFIELLGRRSVANLASIAETIGKPLLDCELYLQCLRSGAQEHAFNVEEVPMCDEAGEDNREATVLESEDHIMGALDSEKGECLLRLDRLEVRMDHSFSEDSVSALVDAVKQKIKTLVKYADRRQAFPTPRAGAFDGFVEEAPQALLGFCRSDEVQREREAPIPGTGPLPFGDESGSESDGSETVSEEEPDSTL